jgi:ATP-dependent Clp protease adapter protein ClpS
MKISVCFVAVLSVALPRWVHAFSTPSTAKTNQITAQQHPFGVTLPTTRLGRTELYMSDRARERSTRKGVQTIIKEQTEEKQEEKKEEMYRVLLHNDEVHTFQYVVRALTKVIGILDRKAAFEICVETHGRGKAVITKTWKKQAMQFCMGLQRQGLTVSITPDEDYEGGHYGGGNV